jgi:hypothetical protein
LNEAATRSSGVLAAVAGYFKNLPTATKLFILCGVFTVAIAVPIYSLVIEEKVAFDFTRKELVGIRARQETTALRDSFDEAIV